MIAQRVEVDLQGDMRVEEVISPPEASAPSPKRLKGDRQIDQAHELKTGAEAVIDTASHKAADSVKTGNSTMFVSSSSTDDLWQVS